MLQGGTYGNRYHHAEEDPLQVHLLVVPHAKRRIHVQIKKEKMKVIVNCPNCKGNSMAEVVFHDYAPAEHFDRTLRCLTCDHPINEHIDLTPNKKEASDGNLGNHVLPDQFTGFSNGRIQA